MVLPGGAQLAKAASFCAYAVGCSAFHGLLQQHYLATCRSSWLALFAVDPGPYCALVRKGLSVLQWTPLVASGFLLPAPAVAGLFRD